MLSYCENKLDQRQFQSVQRLVEEAREAARKKSAWRIEGTLREFPKFSPVNLWFQYPIHRVDESGVLGDIEPEKEQAPWKKGAAKNQKKAGERKEDRKKALEEAVEGSNFGDKPSVKEVANFLGISKKSVRDRVKEHGGYVVDGAIRKKSNAGKMEG